MTAAMDPVLSPVLTDVARTVVYVDVGLGPDSAAVALPSAARVHAMVQRQHEVVVGFAMPLVLSSVVDSGVVFSHLLREVLVMAVTVFAVAGSCPDAAAVAEVAIDGVAAGVAAVVLVSTFVLYGTVVAANLAFDLVVDETAVAIQTAALGAAVAAAVIAVAIALASAALAVAVAHHVAADLAVVRVPYHPGEWCSS